MKQKRLFTARWNKETSARKTVSLTECCDCAGKRKRRHEKQIIPSCPVQEGGSCGELSQKPKAVEAIERGSGGSPSMMLRSPKAHGRRNMRKTIEMPKISLARSLLKSTKRSRTSGQGGRGNGKTKEKEQDHANTPLCVCGQQPLAPVLSSPRRLGRADAGQRRWLGPEASWCWCSAKGLVLL